MQDTSDVRHIVMLLALFSLSLAGPATAQMMGGGAAVAGNGVGGRAFGYDDDGSSRYDPVMQYNLGVADFNAGKFKDADKEFGRALISDPRNVLTLTMLGQTKEAEGDLRGAVKAYEKALKIDPTAVAPRRYDALALAKLGEKDQAQTQFATLQTQAQACGETCPNAADLKAALVAVQAALSPPAGGPAAG